MSTLDAAVQAIKEHDSRFNLKTTYLTATLGDGSGTVEVPGRGRTWVYARPRSYDGNPMIVRNTVVPNRSGSTVFVARSSAQPDIWQVVEPQVMIKGQETTFVGGVAFHHEQHEWGHPSGADDTVFVRFRQVTDLRVSPTSTYSQSVEVADGLYEIGDTVRYFPGETIDLSSYWPSAGMQRWVIISAAEDADENGITVTAGDEKRFVYLSDIPTGPSGEWRLAAVRLRASDTEISDWPDDAMIQDLRFGRIANTDTYLSLTDTADSSFAGLAGKIPIVDDDEESLFLGMISMWDLSNTPTAAVSGDSGKALVLDADLDTFYLDDIAGVTTFLALTDVLQSSYSDSPTDPSTSEGHNNCADGGMYDTGSENDWNNTDNIENSSTASYATSSVNANPVETTEYLVARDFGFNLPDDAIIVGIEVKISHWTDNTYVRDETVKLWNGDLASDNSIGNNQANASDWANGSDEEFTYGGAESRWGATLTKAIVESSNFGVCLVAERHDGALGDKGVRCHYITMKVYYTAPVVGVMINDSETGLVFTQLAHWDIVPKEATDLIDWADAHGSSGQIPQLDANLVHQYVDFSLASMDDVSGAGNDGQILEASGGAAIWVDHIHGVVANWDGGGELISTGIGGFIPMPWPGEIKSARLVIYPSGEMKIDVWKCAWSAFPPSNANSITNSHEPEVTPAGYTDYVSASGWSAGKAFDEAQILLFYVDSVTGAEKATLVLKVEEKPG